MKYFSNEKELFGISFQIFCSAKLEGVHREFQKAVLAGACHYVPERNVLVLLSKLELSKRRASMIQEMYFRNLSQKVSFFFFFAPSLTYLTIFSIGISVKTY